jgi:hypothetical protein
MVHAKAAQQAGGGRRSCKRSGIGGLTVIRLTFDHTVSRLFNRFNIPPKALIILQADSVSDAGINVLAVILRMGRSSSARLAIGYGRGWLLNVG